MSVAEEITKLAALRDGGALTEEEFQAEKSKVLGGEAPDRSDESQKAGRLNLPVKIAIAVCVVFMAMVFFSDMWSNSPEMQAQYAGEKAIEACWADYQRKSLTPGEKRSIATVCEMMEAEYVARWGRKP